MKTLNELRSELKNQSQTVKQITRPILGVNGLVYSFEARYPTKEDARFVCLELVKKHVYKHVYYTRIQENGIKYYDVRTSNLKIQQ